MCWRRHAFGVDPRSGFLPHRVKSDGHSRHVSLGAHASGELELAIGKTRRERGVACVRRVTRQSRQVDDELRGEHFVSRKAVVSDAIPHRVPRVIESGREERDGNRDLRHDERCPGLAQPQTIATAGGEILQSALHTPPRGLQRGHDADNRRGADRQDADIGHRVHRHTEIQPERQLSHDLEQRRIDLPQAHRHHPKAQRRRHAGQCQRLDEKLHHDAAAAGAKRRPHCNLGPPRGGAGVNEDGDVDAHNRQERRDEILDETQGQRVLRFIHVRRTDSCRGAPGF